MRGATLLVAGILVTVGSLVLNSKTGTNKFALFIFAGVFLILFGIYRISREKSEGFKVPEWNAKSPFPDARKTRVNQPTQAGQAQGIQQQQQRQEPTQPAPQGVKVCSNCGTRMPVRASFCAVCGQRL
ncbi:MAG: zinc ribbon domain-containing protein [DPANN group archaeon]|nr:zinc ribbon domain-containing protein [DPANN group archaeon]